MRNTVPEEGGGVRAPPARPIGVLVVLVLVFVGWFAGQYYFSAQIRHDPASQDVADLLIVATDCNASRSQCLAKNQSLALYLKLGPPVDALEPFNVEVTIAGGEGRGADSVDIEFLMSGMDMGINRYRLEASESDIWYGRAVLPVCTTGRRDWHAVVNVVAGTKRLQASFPFTVDDLP